MKTGLKKILVFAAAAAAALAVSGCGARSSDEQLYCLPQLSEGYIQLQDRINQVLATGAEYAAPASGTYRQAVQLIDLDGDLVDEAVACFSVRGDDKPLKVYVFRSVDGAYEEAAKIEGEGTSIESIGFPDMNGDGALELAVGWQLSGGVNMLSVYSMDGFQPSRVISTDYAEYTITQLTGADDVVVFRLSGSELSGEAELYSMTGDGEILSSTARLSDGIEALLRIRTGSLLDGQNAVYVEGTINGSGIITDIFACRGKTLTNVTRDETKGVSDTARCYTVYCRDVNSDGVLDVPLPVALPAQAATTNYYVIEWYSFYRSGLSQLTKTTYHNYSDEWYLIIPDSWRGCMTLRRENSVSGERAVVFSEMEGDEAGKDFLAIYALSGDNRQERATAGSRFILKENESVIYAAEILSTVTGSGIKVSPEMVKRNFDVIYSEWITGDT